MLNRPLGSNAPNPFEDADGKNPFAEPSRSQSEQESSEGGASAAGNSKSDKAEGNIFAAPQPSAEHASEPAYDVYDYATTEKPRAKWLLALAVFSLLLAASVVSQPQLALLSFCLGNVALFLSRQDLKAIEAGVMDPKSKTLAVINLLIGLTAVLVTIGIFVLRFLGYGW